jgi:pSer/pThr/pTyr-binding forkhead associated (FHA) protein
MILKAQDSRQPLQIYPQNLEHELIIGRSTEDSAIVPDIDLAEVGAGELGVSRLHLALYFDHDTNTVCVHDLGSTNGSFVNGQKLHPHTVRVLYDGDELRLGKLSLRVYFQHQGKT